VTFSRKLTKTEKLVYDKALLGFSRSEMAEIFGCEPNQISRMLSNVYQEFDVRDRDQLMARRIAQLEDLLHKNGIEYD